MKRQKVIQAACIIVLGVLFLSGCQTTHYQGPISDHFDGKQFYNPGEKDIPQSPWYDLFNLWRGIFQNPWPKNYPTMKLSTPTLSKNSIQITFINHSTVLIKTKEVNFITDPIYSYRASPLPLIGPVRVREPGIAFSKLPKIDVVLISHNHYDHLDIPTLQKLNKAFHPIFIVPLGNAYILKRNGIKNVKELDWWQSIKIKNALVTLLPARHSSQRGLHDYNHSLWGAYGIEVDGKKIFYAGDTAYSKHFKTIRQKWGQPDFSILPIGAYEPRSLHKGFHVNPLEAVNGHIDLQSKQSIGIHWGTFQMSVEKLDQPIKDLHAARKKLNIKDTDFLVVPEGWPVSIQ